MQAELTGLRLFRSGKVRDTFDLGDRLLMVATDRLSAFDVVLPTPIPRKGAVLTQLSKFWFGMTKRAMPNHFLTADPAELRAVLGAEAARVAGRAMIVKKAERIDIECVVRGYLAGSAWAEYREHGTVAGETMPPGLRQAQAFPEPIFTPSAKADTGHDVNISRAELANRVGQELATTLETASIELYQLAADYARRRGLLIADTKFEFGFVDGELTVIDELLTPDSSRFWEAQEHQPGRDPASFDKQFVRDWLSRSGWNKTPPGPELPPEVVAGTAARYHEAYKRLTGKPLWIATET